MSKARIHPAYCRCPQCAPRHPRVTQIAPSLKAALLALAGTFAFAAAVIVLRWAMGALSVWS